MKCFSNFYLSDYDGTSATITIRTWIFYHLLSLLNLLPVIGFLIWLGLYLYLGFSYETAPSLANYIKSQLIITGAILGATLVILLSIFAYYILVIK